MSPITTHVLDTSAGRPAAGVSVHLFLVEDDGRRTELAAAATNDDGRIADLLAAGEASEGVYVLRFETAAYFTRRGQDSFFPRVEIEFCYDPDGGHCHVPLLLSPFGYSTYRGS